MDIDQVIKWCHERDVTVRFQPDGNVVATMRAYPGIIAPSLEAAVKGLQKDIEERAFLQTVREEDKAAIQYLLHPFPPGHDLDEVEQKELATMLARYPEMARYL
jgi:hypothetical protein